jgi:hypothetical protein
MRVLGVNANDLVAGLVVVLIGALTLLEALNYPAGAALRMGPGYFPQGLSLITIVAGIGIVLVEGRRRGEAEVPAIAWRSLLAVMSAILAFALLIERLGLAAAVFAAVLISGAAQRNARLEVSVSVALTMATLSVAIFRFVLGLQVPVFKW